jgi:hypothetical protein
MSKIGDLLSNVFQEMARKTLKTSFSHILKTVKKICQYVKFQYQTQKKPLG